MAVGRTLTIFVIAVGIAMETREQILGRWNLSIKKNQIIRFFNPRIDNWFAHFKVENGLILPKTKIGRATIKILDFNNSYDIEFRKELILLGLFP